MAPPSSARWPREVGVKLVVFGLSISSSWGNGHATLWRALVRALGESGARVVFFERDVPYYAEHRDRRDPAWGELRLYRDFTEALPLVRRELADADVAVVTSFCPDGAAAPRFIWSSAVAMKVFYDLDTPVTLARLEMGEPISYLPAEGLAPFDLVLSFTGGTALAALRNRLGARRVVPFYGWVDPQRYRPSPPVARFRGDLSYLGTYTADRQAALAELFVAPACLRPDRRFVLGGAQYPETFPWRYNIFFVRHVPPDEHPGFYCSSRLTLNVTRRAMAELGYCPSGRLFEAAACGVPLASDVWKGLSDFFRPGEEILLVETREDVCLALELSDLELGRLARAARARVLAEHTAASRARTLLELLGRSAHRTEVERFPQERVARS